MTDIQVQKKLLRCQIKEENADGCARIRQEESREAASLLFAHPIYIAAPVLLAYMAAETEMDTRRIIEKAAADGKATAIPRITDRGHGMDFYLTDPSLPLRGQTERNKYGIWEPKRSLEKLSVCRIPPHSLVLIPGLAFTKQGIRLGHGGGYYDRYLKDISVPAVFCGCALSCMIVRHIPSAPHDISMDCLLTAGHLTFMQRKNITDRI